MAADRSKIETIDACVEAAARVFARRIALLHDPEFVRRNQEGLDELARGEPGLSLGEFRAQYPYSPPA